MRATSKKTTASRIIEPGQRLMKEGTDMITHKLNKVLCSLLALTFTVTSINATAAEGVRYVHTDHLGTPIVWTDETGNIIKTSEYEPYGLQVSGPVEDGPGYTGHVEDAATGLTYMQQRYYDPRIGMFLSVDPVTAHSNPVGQFNRYRYANGNPYLYMDPDGRESYLVSRPVNLPANANHNFIVHDAKYLGDPNATVRSFGDQGDDTMGPVDASTKGFSEGTYESDQKAWASSMDDSSEVTYRKIDASDEDVAAIASSMVAGDEYSSVPEMQGGVNSNSAAGAIATRADGGSSNVDNGRAQPGSSDSVVKQVKFKETDEK